MWLVCEKKSATVCAHTSPDRDFAEPACVAETVAWLKEECGLDDSGAEQAIEYILQGRAVLGDVPTQDTIIAERFFDEGGGMQLIIHAPYGGRINKAWGLALRKRFCRSFNFELQAAATDNGLNIALAEQHSFPLADVFHFLNAETVQPVLEQAALASPIFGTRWRWDANRALALLRFQGGKKVPPQIQRMRSDDLLASVFPDVAACQENIVGDIQIPDHPLVKEVMKDVLTEAMDIDGLKALLSGIQQGRIRCLAVDTPVPSQFSHEILNANPYAYLDDAPLEERRARAVEMRRILPESVLEEVGKLDPAAIAQVREEAWPDVRDADELHDVLHTLIAFPQTTWGQPPSAVQLSEAEQLSLRPGIALISGGPPDSRAALDRTAEGGCPHVSRSAGEWQGYFERLLEQGRAVRARARRSQLLGRGGAGEDIFYSLPRRRVRPSHPRDSRQPAVLRRCPAGAGHRLDVAPGPGNGFAAWRVCLGFPLLRLKKLCFGWKPPAPCCADSLPTLPRGRVARDHTEPELEWCERRLLARIHRLTVATLRKQIEPVTAAQFMRWLLRWQHVAAGAQVQGERATLDVLRQLQGFEIPANAWERQILGRRIANYDPKWLDQLCLTGAVGWGRLSPHPATLDDTAAGKRRVIPTSVAPITFFVREEADWMTPHRPDIGPAGGARSQRKRAPGAGFPAAARSVVLRRHRARHRAAESRGRNFPLGTGRGRADHCRWFRQPALSDRSQAPRRARQWADRASAAQHRPLGAACTPTRRPTAIAPWKPPAGCC